MHPTKYFIELRKNIEKRLRKYQVLIYKADSPFIWTESDQTLSYIVIQCLNLWFVFSRTYFLSCVLSPFRENGSSVICTNPSIRTFNDAIDMAIHVTKPRIWRSGMTGRWTRQDEPPWGNTSNFMNSCNAIGCSNYQEIQNAFSIQARVFKDLPKFRHFYAHRNEDTAKEALYIARQYYSIPIIPTNNHPTKMLLQAAYGRPQSCLILDWIDDIINTVDLLCN
jgi:hypothetical protein